jgi:hypothetical protein
MVKGFERRWDLLAAFCCYLLMFWRVGYFFGDGDHLEVLSQVLRFNDPNLFQKDYLLNYIGYTWTVRTPFVLLSAFLAKIHLEWSYLIVHIALYTGIFYAMIRLARAFGLDFLARWVPFLAIIVFYGKSTGANDLYHPQFISESISIALSIWAILAYKTKAYKAVGALLFFSILFHPLAGFQVMLLLYISWFVSDWPSLRTRLLSQGLFVLVGAIYVFWLGRESSGGEQYFTLLVKLRNPHHYLPSVFPKTHLILLGVMALGIFYLNPKNDRFIYTWTLITLFICLVYTVSIGYFESVLFAKSQWFKATIWLRIWFAICVLGLFEKKIEGSKKYIDYVGKGVFFGVSFAFLFMISIFKSDNQFRTLSDLDLEMVAAQVRPILDEEALCVQPLTTTGFQYPARASLFVSFKSVVHYSDFLNEWYDRINLLYGPLNQEISGFEQTELAHENYHRIDSGELTSWRKQGITHCLFEMEIKNPELHLRAHSGKYYFYEISR